MALKHLTGSEMTAVSESWLNPRDAAYQLLMDIPELIGFTPHVKRAHEMLLQLDRTQPTTRRDEIVEESAAADAEHDSLARGIFDILTHGMSNSKNGEPYQMIRQALMPSGLKAVVGTTYRGQAGHAAKTRLRLDSKLVSSLNAVFMPDGSRLLSQVEDWIVAGIRLGKLEQESARLASPENQTPAGVSLTARNLWVRTVNLMLAAADLAELESTTTKLLFGPLQDAEETAMRRLDRGQKNDLESLLPPPNPEQSGAHSATAN